MRCFFVVSFLCSTLFAWNPDEAPNVNSRYVVESVHVSGKRSSRLSEGARRDMEGVVGQNLDHSLLDRIASRIKTELRADRVAIQVAKGTKPDQVAVEFAVETGRNRDFDLDLPKGVYHSKQGWSGGVESTVTFGDNSVVFGVVSDGDALVERFSGVRARYERTSLGTERIRFRFDLDSYHQQWNSSTLTAAPSAHFSPDLYRARLNFQPSVTFVIAEPLTVSVGVGMQRLQPTVPAAGTDSANSMLGTVRFHRLFDNPTANQEVDAGYSVRSATSLLSTDYAYTRHAVKANYRVRHGRSTVAVDFLAGRINGDAPLFERFVLGNGGTLRGWNKFDLDPLGGDRVVHGSIEYSYRGAQVFYDTGAIWDRRTDADAKQSVGFGFGRTGREGFILAVAFPLRPGGIDPIFIAGFNF